MSEERVPAMESGPGEATGPAPGLNDLLALFAGTAERVEVGGDRPFLLAGDGVWLVEAGHVDVFSVRLQDGAAAGHRTHLLRVGPGRGLVGVQAAGEPDGRGLLAVGAAGTVLLATTWSALSARTGAAEHAAATRSLLEGWVEGLCAGISPDVWPQRCLELEADAEWSVTGLARARVSRRVCWVRPLEGGALLLGREALALADDGPTPLTRRVWFEAREPARLAVLAGPAVDDAVELWRGVARLHALVLRHAELSARLAETVERERMRRRGFVRVRVLQDACARLASTTAPTNAPVQAARAASPMDGGGDPLLEACRLVGAALRLDVKAESRLEGSPLPRDPLAAILRASRIRARKVMLREDWWRHERGPLLAFRAEGSRPVALLEGHEGYELRDPTSAATEAVTAESARLLEPFAWSFYRRFPDRRLRPSDMLRFAVHGCGRDVAVLLLAGLAAVVLGVVPALATGMLFSTVIPGSQRPQLLQMSVVLVSCALAGWLFNVTQGIALLRIEGRVGAGLQAAVWDRLLSLPLSFFRPYTAGELAVRAMSVDGIRQVLSGSTATALIGGILSAGNVALMFHFSPPLAWRASLVIALAVSMSVCGSYRQLGPQRASVRLQARASGLVLQLLTAVAKLRTAGVETAAFGLWSRDFSEQRRHQFQARRASNWVTAVSSAIPLAAFTWLFWVALPLVTESRSMATGDFLAFLAAFSSCLAALFNTSMALLSTLDVVPLYEQAKPILEALPEVDMGKSDPGVLSGDIEVQHAFFRYQPDGPLILRDVSLRIHPGEFVAFVGPSGSGKSTLLRLLLGFEKLESGAIYFDGQELSGIDIQAVRRQIGVVLQSGRLMSGDVFTNIVGSSPATLDEAWEAARMAGLAQDIEEMPMGMHTVITEGGGTLSGGQRQRLMIARAIVSRPRILLFDEATSALDNRTQAVVSASLERLHTTRVVVAHRLSTILHADRIFVVERGRIVQSGTYNELMAESGLFAELARRQIA